MQLTDETRHPTLRKISKHGKEVKELQKSSSEKNLDKQVPRATKEVEEVETKEPLNELEELGLNSKIVSTLKTAGIETLAQLRNEYNKMPVDEKKMDIKGIGVKTTEEIAEFIESFIDNTEDED